jgi:hypothetical protein
MTTIQSNQPPQQVQIPPSNVDTTDFTSNTAVSGDWVVQLAKMMISGADSNLNYLMTQAQNANSTATVLANLSTQLAAYSNGMDARADGKSGDTGSTALNPENVSQAEVWDTDIAAAIQQLPPNSPYAAQLEALEFGTGAGHSTPKSTFDASSFTCSAATMSGLQSNLAAIQKANDSDVSMQTFYVQQAVSDRDQQITMLSSIQSDFNKTLDTQAQQV